ncbi:hypothetical protein [Leminorella grimontii]|uniref:hypothetical protein n=1 Tax=Leminorella grimontii TaxID=82981 RepID=UPI00208C84DD|nr:hypothetical protein [Leminorella grimontii]GKX58599.1 hypothetical protein SOASR031_09140 [Leminorella grimontii]
MEFPYLNSTKSWTYADITSSYRFWGIMLCFLLMTFSFLLSFNSIPLLMSASARPPRETGMLYSFNQIGMLLSIIPAWMASRIKNVYPFYAICLLALLGFVLTYFYLQTLPVVCLGWFFTGLSQGALLLLIPAYIAGAAGSVEAFVLAFGLCITLKLLIQIYVPFFLNAFLGEWAGNISGLYIVISAVALVSILFLLPVKRELFNAVPRARLSSVQASTNDSPVAVFFLTAIVPFYVIYWVARAHREVWFHAPSSRLFTSWASGWLILFVPFSFSVLCSTLNDTVREMLKKRCEDEGTKTRWIVLAALLLPPLGAAMMQSQINRLAKSDVDVMDDGRNLV